MDFEIEIVEGHNPASYFCIHPIKYDENRKIKYSYEDKFVLSKDEISIEENNVEGFLQYFFTKNLDDEYIYNQMMVDNDCIEPNLKGF